MNITIASSTDSPQAVRAALGSMAAPEEVKETKAAPVESTPVAQDAHESADADGETEETSEEAKAEADESTEDSEAKEGDESSEDEEKKKPKKKGGYQRKAERFQKEAEARAQEVEYWKQQALKNAGGEKPADASKAVDFSKKPSPDDFETVADFVEAISDWKVKEAKKEFEESQKQTKAQSEIADKSAKFNQNIAKLAEAKPDIKELAQDALQANVRVAPHLEQLLFESDKQAEVYYKLLNDWDLVDKLNQSSPIAAAKLFGRIEAELELESKSEESKTPVIKNKPSAPPPLKPVGKAAPKIAKSPDDMSQDEYRRWRESKK